MLACGWAMFSMKPLPDGGIRPCFLQTARFLTFKIWRQNSYQPRLFTFSISNYEPPPFFLATPAADPAHWTCPCFHPYFPAIRTVQNAVVGNAVVLCCADGGHLFSVSKGGIEQGQECVHPAGDAFYLRKNIPHGGACHRLSPHLQTR